MKSRMKKSSFSEKNNRKENLKLTKKSLHKMQFHNLDNVDSLNCLMHQKAENIDDKYLKLKSELNSLFVKPKVKTDESLSKSQTESGQMQGCDRFTKPSDSNISSCLKSKFSEWLSETIDKIDEKFPTSDFSKKIDHGEPLPSTAKVETKGMYNMALLPDFKVEKLLYKSFYLQNFGIYLISSSDESEPEGMQSKENNKQRKRRSRKKRIYSSSFTQKNLKRKRAVLDSDVEIIHVENGLNEDEHKKVHYVDLAFDDYDWDEPFYTANTAHLSDLEIIEDSQNDASSNQKKQNINAENTSSKRGQEKNNDFTSPSVKRTWECPICFEMSHGQSIVATLCGHIFCKTCLEENNSTHGKLCPTCRLDISDKEPIILFNL